MRVKAGSHCAKRAARLNWAASSVLFFYEKEFALKRSPLSTILADATFVSILSSGKQLDGSTKQQQTASYSDGKQPLNLQPRFSFAVAEILGEILVCTRNLTAHSWLFHICFIP